VNTSKRKTVLSWDVTKREELGIPTRGEKGEKGNEGEGGYIPLIAKESCGWGHPDKEGGRRGQMCWALMGGRKSYKKKKKRRGLKIYSSPRI